MTNSNSMEPHGINFQPIPKRFMVWDKETEEFWYDFGGQTKEFDYIKLGLWLANRKDVHGLDLSRFEVIQSTNLFDKDGKEIFEGGIIDYNDDGSVLGVVVGGDGEWCLKDRNGNVLFLKGAPHQKLVGHILSNPELVEEYHVQN